MAWTVITTIEVERLIIIIRHPWPAAVPKKGGEINRYVQRHV